MSYTGQILALDLATRTGWACGRAQDPVPVSGSVRFGRNGSTPAAVLYACRQWLGGFLSGNPAVQLVVFEAPLIPMFKRGATNIATIRQLMGLCAVVEELLYAKGGYDVREAKVSEVRNHFIGHNPKREIAKAKTIYNCKMLGWDPVDDNAADALALWDYQASLLYPLRRH